MGGITSEIDWVCVNVNSGFTFAHTQLQTFVLVGEYDTPMSKALRHGYLEQVATPPRIGLN